MEAPQAPERAPWFSLKQAKDFAELRNAILNLIGRAEKRVILVTDFLTDGEISTVLYLAQYRKIKVTVFLDQRKMNQYLSRLGYLKAQNIAVLIRPDSMSIKAPTILAVDQQLFQISRDLDVLRPSTGGTIQQVHPKLLSDFESEIAGTLRQGNQAIPKPLPLVGRPRGNSPLRQNTPSPYQGERDGSYNYDRSWRGREGAPSGVTTKLPKVPLYRKRKIQIEDHQRNSEDTQQQNQVFDGSSKDRQRIDLDSQNGSPIHQKTAPQLMEKDITDESNRLPSEGWQYEINKP